MRIAAGLVAALALAAGGCAWRIESPTALGEAVRVQVVADQGRLPRFGVLLQAAVAEAIPAQTGWRVRPDASAKLELTIDRDRIHTKADDDRGVPVRWEIELSGTALLVSARGTRTFQWSGNGYAGGRDGEKTALDAAAADASATIARWLARVDLGPTAQP